MFIAELPDQAIVSLQESRYGYSVVDVGIGSSDLIDFDQIQIDATLSYIQLGEPSIDDLARFLGKIGPNDANVMQRIASRIAEITHQILQTSGRETMWFSLRSFTPTSQYDTPRWHMDGQYYRASVKDGLQYRFAMTLVGPSTWFYPLPTDFLELRKSVWVQMTNRKLMVEMFGTEQAFSPNRGEGVFFIGGNNKKAALHSEPPIHEPRLFLALVPCSQEDLKNLNGFKY